MSSSSKTTDIEATPWSSPDTTEVATEGSSPPLFDNNNDNNNTARINFRPTRTIDRLLPKILLDRHKMTLEAWEDFCDSTDEDIEPYLRAEHRNLCGLCALGCIPISILVGLAIGGIFGATWINIVVFAMAFPWFFVSVLTYVSVEERARDKAMNSIADRCAEISNRDPELILKLHAGDPKVLAVKSWYIEVTLRNIDGNNNNNAAAAAVAASVTAIPVVAEAIAATPISAVGSPHEKENP